MFYTMESVRDQIAGKYKVDTLNLSKDWTKKCPCAIVTSCKAQGAMICKERIIIFVDTPFSSALILEIVFFLIRERMFARRIRS